MQNFADIFDVKSKRILTLGTTQTTWQQGVLTTEYRSGSFYRAIATKPVNSSSPARYANSRLMFDVAIAPGETWHTCVNFTVSADGRVFVPLHTCSTPYDTEAVRERDDFLQQATNLESYHAQVREFYRQALVDMAALRIDVEHKGNQFWMPAAGIPWFMAVFGRDAIVASLQSLAVYHGFARGRPIKLAQVTSRTRR